MQLIGAFKNYYYFPDWTASGKCEKLIDFLEHKLVCSNRNMEPMATKIQFDAK